MANYDSFHVKANRTIVNKVYSMNKHLFDQYEFYEDELWFSLHEMYVTIFVKSLARMRITYPSEVIYLIFSPESHNRCKMEHYEVSDGRFIFKGITWEIDYMYDDSDNIPELLLFKRRENRLKLINVLFQEIITKLFFP